MIFLTRLKVLYHLYHFPRCRNGQGLKVVQVLIYDLYHTCTTYTVNGAWRRKNRAKTCTTPKNYLYHPEALNSLASGLVVQVVQQKWRFLV